MYLTQNERKADALGVPRKRVLGVKVLVRAGACRPREELARSFTSPPPLDLDHALLFALYRQSRRNA